MKPKQAAGLLTDSNKYLSHILVKGLKGDFTPVTSWLMGVYSGSKHFSTLIKNEEDNNAVHMALNALKGGLYSKNKEVATWTAKVYSKIAYDFISLDLIKPAWEWFISLDGGLDGTVYMLQKHNEMESLILDLYLNIGKNSINELFTHYLKTIIKESFRYWQLILSFIEPLSTILQKDPENKLAMQSTFEFWLDCACRQADNDGKKDINERVTALNLLSELWQYLPEILESKEEVTNHALTMFKRATRDKNSSLQIFAFSHLFKLLEKFAEEKKKYAPVIYKTLAFSLVENHQNLMIREFIMKNLLAVYNQYPQIPISIVIDPLIKQIQLIENESYVNNLFDFDFISSLSTHPKIAGKSAVQFVDMLARIMLKEPIYAKLAKIPFLSIVSSQSANTSIQDFLLKFIKVYHYLFSNF